MNNKLLCCIETIIVNYTLSLRLIMILLLYYLVNVLNMNQSKYNVCGGTLTKLILLYLICKFKFIYYAKLYKYILIYCMFTLTDECIVYTFIQYYKKYACIIKIIVNGLLILLLLLLLLIT